LIDVLILRINLISLAGRTFW